MSISRCGGGPPHTPIVQPLSLPARLAAALSPSRPQPQAATKPKVLQLGVRKVEACSLTVSTLTAGRLIIPLRLFVFLLCQVVFSPHYQVLVHTCGTEVTEQGTAKEYGQRPLQTSVMDYHADYHAIHGHDVASFDDLPSTRKSQTLCREAQPRSVVIIR